MFSSDRIGLCLTHIGNFIVDRKLRSRPAAGAATGIQGQTLRPGMRSLLGLALFLVVSTTQAKIEYTLSFENRAEHLVTVRVGVDEISRREYVDFKMPAWTPGSYVIQDFARNIQDFEVTSGNRPLPVTKLDKQTWRVHLDGDRRITVEYKVYAFEPTVRTSYVDKNGAMLNGASIFVYVDGMEGAEPLVAINVPSGWQRVTTSLPSVGGRNPVYRAENYDMLVDSPIMVGNHEVIPFRIGEITHTIAIAGQGNYDRENLINDSKKIFQEIYKIFGSVTFNDYTVFITIREEGYGGLEHHNSTHLLYSRWKFGPGKDYQRFLELLAHEVFHAFNVKGVHPAVFGKLDYAKENYTTLLWAFEGITSYYDRLLLHRAGHLDENEYLGLVAKDIKVLESRPGRQKQTLQQASWDAWIKFYQSDENDQNVSISYYRKGSLVGLALDLAIRSATNGQKSLDDVFHDLWVNFIGSGKGITHEEFKLVCESIAGRPLDDIFRYVTTTEEIDWEPILAPFGLQVKRYYDDPADSTKAYYGFKTLEEDGRLIIARVNSGTPASKAGLSVNDELLFVDSHRLLGSHAQQVLDSRAQGALATFILNRDGAMQTVRVRPGKEPYTAVRIEQVAQPTNEQQTLYRGWLQIP